MTASPTTHSSAPCGAALELLRHTGAVEPTSPPGQLDRGQLDFSLASLREIDRYLNGVHASVASGGGRSILTTVWAVALYVGEVIRRSAPAGRYVWITVGESTGPRSAAPAPPVDIAVVWALQADGGEVCLPSRAVLRAVLRGQKARSIESFARGALEPVSGVLVPGPRLRAVPVAAASLSA